MSKVRIDSSVHDKLRKYLDESESWSKQSSFVSQAVREKLEREKIKQERMDEDQVEIIEEIVERKLEEQT